MAFRNGTYSGFAQKGGTDREHLAIAVEQAERKNPNSHLWANFARSAMQSLADILGSAQYAQWAELTWPGASIDDFTWLQICNQSEAALALAKGGERDLDILKQAACLNNSTDFDTCHNFGEPK